MDETARPFLYILQKAIAWKENLHPRDTFGKFRGIKGGSSVVTSTGKTGVVEKVGDSHYHVRFTDGKLAKVTKNNVIHAEDHKKVLDAQAKTKKAQVSAVKGQATKATNKANGHGKAVALEAVPKVKSGAQVQSAKVRAMEKKASAENRAIRNSKKQRDLEAPAIVQQTIGETDWAKGEVRGKEQNTKLEEYKNLDQDENTTSTVDGMWSAKTVQKLMAKSPEKRSEKDIRKLSGDITTENDKLARHVVLKMGASRGLNLVHQINRIGDVGESGDGEVINQETGYYGDLLQAARASMYETLHNVMAGSQNPKEGTSIGAHVVNRMKQTLHRDIYALMNDIPAPHEIRSAIGDMKKAEQSLTQELGRTPEHAEIAEHLQKNSKNFREASIAPAPSYDEKAGQWVATKGHIKDPSERLRMLKNYAEQQRTSSLDINVGSEGEREVSLSDNLKDAGRTPEETYERKARNKELKTAIPQALSEMGLSPVERKIFMLMFGQPSEKQNKGHMTMQEVADYVNDGGRHEGQQISASWVNKYMRSGMEKLARAREDKHPALGQLAMLKSIFFDMLQKFAYEYDLVKSLSSWGVDTSILTEKFTRAVYGDSLYSLRKSLAPHEYIGSVITTDTGELHARVIELALPEDNMLYKSFNVFMDDLKKSMFPHKGGSNHAVNQKASEYVKANAKKYNSLSEAQHGAAKKKSSGHTWSEELLLKNPGSAWITWGGKRVLVNVGDGKIIYDSKNETHREEHNQGAQEGKIEFHHEGEDLAKHEEEREADVRKTWADNISRKEKEAAKGKTFDYAKEREAFAKKHKGASFDEEGKLQFQRDTEVNDDNAHILDHGIQAFKGQMEEMQNAWTQKDEKGQLAGGLKKDFLDAHSHKALDAYAELSEEERAKLDGMKSKEEKAEYLGNHLLNSAGTKEALQKYHDTYHSGNNASEAEDELREHLKGIGSVAGRNARMMDRFLKDVQKYDPSKADNMDALTESFGGYEMQRAREEANKNLLPEGKYMIGNPITGKSMVVHIGGGFEGGRAGKGGKYAPTVVEAFDPEGGAHEDINSWGQLGKALGYTGKDADNIKAVLTQSANTEADKPFMKQIDDAEYNKNRANTKLGMQETMLHKEFKLVDQQRAKDGSLKSQTFAQDMPDGTQNHITVDKDGYISDPIMARLVKQKKAIKDANDLHEVMKNAVGNRAWVTAHFGSDIHIGDALGHHVQLEYDGKGAPRVVGGNYDGYRFMDTRDIPKGATDPATGEPIKALFKNGKLVDRKFTVTNEIPMKTGNAVMYKSGAGTYRKGRIHSIEDGNYKVTDGHGHVIGIFKKDELKAATEKGRTLSDSGQAVAKLAKKGTHRMDTDETFKAVDPKDQKKLDKVRSLFEQALQKAKINHAFDDSGKLRKDLELSDPMMRELQKRLGRSKAGKALLKEFTSAYTKELELHVPDHLKAQVEAEGVAVHANGTARISAGKFEQLRDTLGGLSVHHEARDFLTDHFERKDRKPKSQEQLQKLYQSFQVPDTDFGKHYKAQFKSSSYVAQETLPNGRPGGLYSTQLEGLDHLITRGRGIAGHGMGTGKTILGVMAAMHYKAQKLANGEKPKKTLIVSPAGIQSDWGKEIGSHTNSKALYIGSASKLRKRDENGNWMKSENGRHMFGQDGTEQEATDSKSFLKNMGKHASEDHDFHVMSYDQFMKMRDQLASSGMYDNIVVDEVHAFKNQGGKRGKSLAETTDSFKNVWGLSGTPMENDAREVHSLVDTITGGRHELGTQKEFQDKFLMKDKNGKIVGVKPQMTEKLGDILANLVQFRGSQDVTYNDGSKIHFPSLVGQATEDSPNPQTDFIGNLADRSRDHATTDYYGTKHSATDFEESTKSVTNAKSGESYEVKTFVPKNLAPDMQKMYDEYNGLQSKYLPESKLQELATAAATGYDNGGGGPKGTSNYLTAMQKLQKYLNAPLAKKMYVPGGNAIESDVTDAQAESGGTKEGIKAYNPQTGEGHYTVDSDGNKRYFETDGQGGFLKNSDGSPKLLDPLHHSNPKANHLKQRLSTYLDHLEKENNDRRKAGKPELMPKVVVKSAFTTFGTDIIDGVLRDLQKEHPHLQHWASKLKKQGKELGAGRFTGDADDREDTKVGFRGDKNSYDKNQGHLWATTVSPAGKEGVDFGNAHAMFHYDQDWNPQKMAQFTARVRRSDSSKSHSAVDRANSVRVESIHIPGTVEDFMFNAQDSKMRDIKQVTDSTREAEKSPKLGETESKIGKSSRGFTRSQKHKIGAKPKGTTTANPNIEKRPAVKVPKQTIAAKSLKLVILL